MVLDWVAANNYEGEAPLLIVPWTMKMVPDEITAIEEARKVLGRKNNSQHRYGAENRSRNVEQGSCLAEYAGAQLLKGLWVALAPQADPAHPDVIRGPAGFDVKYYRGHTALQADAKDNFARIYMDGVPPAPIGWVDAGWKSMLESQGIAPDTFKNTYERGGDNLIWCARRTGLLQPWETFK